MRLLKIKRYGVHVVAEERPCGEGIDVRSLCNKPVYVTDSGRYSILDGSIEDVTCKACRGRAENQKRKGEHT